MKKIFNKIDKFLNSYFENECEEDMGSKSFFKAMKCYDKEEYKEALKWYLEFEKINTGDKFFYMDLASCYHELKEYRKAKESYEKVLNIDPNYEKAFMMLGYIHYIKEEYSLAIDFYLRFFQIEDENIVIIEYLSLAYFRIKEFEKSIEFNLKWISKDSQNYTPYVNLFESQLMLSLPFSETVEESFKVAHSNPNNYRRKP